MKKLVILHDISSYDDFQVLEHIRLKDVDVIPVEISFPFFFF